MRSRILTIADTLGIRHGLARGRDQLVASLTGSNANVTYRRNHLDDKHLKLLLSFLLRPDSNCLDVGAHRGTFLTHFRRVAPAGHHIAYEPLPDLAAELAEQFPEMDVRQRALSDEEGTTTFVHVRDAPAYSGLKQPTHPVGMTTETITVRTERLDEHLPGGWMPGFVKIDVEGAEALVVRGALDTLRSAKPVMAFEHGRGGGERYGVSDEDMYQLVCDDIGLRLFDMDGNGPLGSAQFNDELASGERWNWIAHE
jgi:FkbM family methyltransferase